MSEIARLKKKLLDLTYRNKLLGLKYDAKSILRVIDEVPDVLFQKLIEGKTLTFIPIPEPTPDKYVEVPIEDEEIELGEPKTKKQRPPALSYATELGFNVSYELPKKSKSSNENHFDNEIQTLMYPDDLETRLSKIYSLFKGTIEETGTNSLYFTIGALEYFQSEDSDQVKRAPLLLFPIKLDRVRATPLDNFTISPTGEEPEFNLSLVEKVRADFGINIPLPTFSAEQSFKLDEYFESLQTLLTQIKPRWRIVWETNLAHLNFGKILLFKDLDSPYWDSGEAANHPVLGQLLFGKPNGSDSISLEGIESQDFEPQIPDLILDADSSQTRAIRSALKGKNLVIQGPPGTGKSQTIANLISAALARKKSVLFIAEKLTALQVVKKRLDDAGLGDFCCEIHSTKTDKKMFLQSIQARRSKHFLDVANLPTKIVEIESQKAKIKKYVDELTSKPPGQTKTLYELIGEHQILSSKLSNKIEEISKLRIEWNTDQDIDSECSALKHFYDSRSNLSLPLSEHPWSVLTDASDHESLTSILKIANDTYEACCSLILWYEKNLNRWDSARKEGFSLESVARAQVDFEIIDRHFETIPESALIQKAQLAPIDILRELRQTVCECAEFSSELSKYFDDPENAKANSRELISLLEKVGQLPDGIQRLSAEQIRLSSQSVSQAQELLESCQVILNSQRESFRIQNLDSLSLKKILEIVSVIENTIVQFKSEPSIFRAALSSLTDEHTFGLLKSLIPEFRKKLTEHEAVFFADILTEDSKDLEFLFAILSESTWFSRMFSKTTRSSFRKLENFMVNTNLSREQELTQLRNFIKFKKQLEAFEKDERFINLLGEHFKGADTRIEQVTSAAAIIEQTGYLFGLELRTFWNDLISTPTIIRESKFGTKELIESLKALESSLSKLSTRYPYLSLVQITEQLRDLETHLGLIRQDKAFSLLPKYLLLGDLVDVPQLLNASIKADKKFSSSSGLFEKLGFEGRVDKIDLDDLDCLIAIREKINNTKLEPNNLLSLFDLQTSLSKLFPYSSTLRNLFASSKWLQPHASLELEEFCSLMHTALANQELLQEWQEYKTADRNLSISPFRELRKIQFSSSEEIQNAARYLLLTRILQQHISSSPTLNNFKGEQFDEIRARYKALDKNLIELNRLKIGHIVSGNIIPEGLRSSRVSERTDLALIEHELSKEKRHIPIRQLLSRAKNAVINLKPCFMMSPMSVAQFLPRTAQFDIVIMDEASQLPVEFAIGAISRGTQLVVVGDTKQLPPSDFFGASENEEPEADHVADDAESILHLAENTFNKGEMLQWHYRSAHESLIQFSNHEFYQNNLVLFPSATSSSDEIGVKFNYLKGIYQGGGANTHEALAILNALKIHAQRSSDQSIGIATMNQKQREIIEDLIDKECKVDPILRVFLEKRINGELYFVKNLENVQGDERDVVLISVTYGPDEAGVFRKQFGPITKKGGERRLNVLFSRARIRMEIFCSFQPEELNGVEAKGSQILQKFLFFARDRKLEHSSTISNRLPDSDFEISVAEAIRALGYEVVPQVGAAGYFIDIGVIDPRNQRNYLVAVECDGATYHSSKSARDRDRLRQQNLEKMGWRVYRIWSTDWFKNRRKEIAQLRSHLFSMARPDVSEEKTNVVELVPKENLPDEELRRQLIGLRETIIKPASAHVADERGILRKSILDLLLKLKPTSEDELKRVLETMDQDIHDDHYVYAPKITQILSRGSKSTASKIDSAT